jgi:hypothetical protein
VLVFAGFLVSVLAWAVAVIALIGVVIDVREKWKAGHFR